MFARFAKARQQAGWLAVEIEANAIRIAHVFPSSSGRPTAGHWGAIRIDTVNKGAALAGIAKEYGLQRFPCTTLLGQGEYQILAVEAPNVPPDEMKAAIRWKIKDLIEYHIDDATVDVLEMPVDPGAPSDKPRSMYAIAAPNEVVQKHIEMFEEVKLGLKVIDIPELAQRNFASHLELPERTTAMLSFRESGSLLTFSYNGELLFARRIGVSWEQLASPEARERYLDRATTELIRLFEHVARQFHQFPVSELLLAPVPEDIGLVEHFSDVLDVPVRAVDLEMVIDFPADAVADSADQWRYFHLFGAALRVEPMAL